MRWLLPFFLLLTQAPAGAAPAPFTIPQIMSAPFASSPLAAPRGATVAWLLNEQGKRNLWVASAPDWRGRKITQLDSDDGQEIAELAWSPDGKTLYFTRGGDFETGGDPPNPALRTQRPDQSIWSVGVDGSPAKKLTDGQMATVSPRGDLVAFLRNGQISTMTPDGQNVVNVVTQKKSAADLQWAPDGHALAFTSQREEHSLIGIYTPGSKTLRYLDASVDTDFDPIWSPDGRQVAFIRLAAESRVFAFGAQRSGQPWSIRVADPQTGVGREVFRATAGPGSVFHGIDAEHQIFWMADGRLIFPWEKTGWCHLYSVAAEGREGPAELTPGVGEVQQAEEAPDGKAVYYSGNMGDIDRRHLWEIADGRAQELTKGEGVEWAATPMKEGTALVYLASSYNEPAHAMVRMGNGETKPLAPGTVTAEFPARELVRPHAVMITAADGMKIHGQLFLPPGEKSGERHPALVFFHGGSRRQMLLGYNPMGYYSNAYSLNQYFASLGYVVLSVNYRSGTGYGLNFREALRYGATGASEFNDVLGAGTYLKGRSDVEPQRIGVWGGSYGGYLTALALARASNLFAAGVDFHGVHNWNLERPSFPPGYLAAERDAAEKLAFQSSPMADVKTWRSPVLLIQGDDDREVPFTETIRLAEALRRQGVPFEQMILPNEVHVFLLHRDWIQAYEATADFFARKLGADRP
jgi:dipeptidyl aminopeptidase/acylaminoacyl peptidase